MTMAECRERVEKVIDGIVSGELSGQLKETYDFMGPEMFGAWLHGYCVGMYCEDDVASFSSAEIFSSIPKLSMN